MPLSERRYRRLADECRRNAKDANHPDERSALLRIGAIYDDLADHKSSNESTLRISETTMATNKPYGDNARKGSVRKGSQLKVRAFGEKHWTKRSRRSGRFVAQKSAGSQKIQGR